MPDKPDYAPRGVPPEDGDDSGTLVAFPQSSVLKQRPLDNLPLELSSFVGREREVAEVQRLMDGTRLLTLYGSGGSGKTRLALAVAQEMIEEFDDGVWWVELASLSDPGLVPGAVAAALDVRETPDRPLSELLGAHLEPRKALLILDNCEHLVDGCAALADTLLRSCPHLKILTTSREPLRVGGEAIWMVPSLSLPDPQRRPNVEQLVSYEAVRLFVERAQAADAAFSLTDSNASVVARLCRRLDGIPLAIELAAARVRALTVEQISQRLEDPLSLLTTGSRTAAPRHRTLRAALEWSYDLLSDPERKLLERLSVFAGGWDLEAAEVVGAGGAVTAGMVLDLLSALVDKSLVLAEGGTEEGSPLRYRMLVPVKQYAREKLEESQEESQIRLRHAEYYLALAERAEPELLGPDQGRWFRRLRTELGNLRATFSWALESVREDEEHARELRLRLVAALWRFWDVQGLDEGKGWLEEVLERDAGDYPAARARALGGLGFILTFQQDYARAIDTLEEAIALYKGLGDEMGTAFALANFGWAVLHGNYRERLAVFVEEGKALMKGNLAGPLRVYLGNVLACAAQGEGDLDSAASQLEEAVALAREIGDLRDAAMGLFILGNVEIERNDFERGAMLLEEGAGVSRGLGDVLGAAYYVWVFGKVSAVRGQPVRAARLWGAAEAVRDEMGMSLSHFDLTASGYEGYVATVRATLSEAAFEKAWGEGRSMSPDQALGYALSEPASASEEISADPSGHPPVERPEKDDRRHNLPVAQGGFVGRERVMEEVKNTLARTQLLTLTGAGGCGKTRLALEVARDVLDDYPDGVWLVRLASITQGDLVPDAVADALGLRERLDLSFTESLVEFLRDRQILLVIDNCEHLIEASARLVDTLLSSCKNLRVLATSREALGIAGEVNWMIPSLTVPEAGQALDPESLTRYESVELFVNSARSRLSEFALTAENAPAVVEICRKLDGIPLAIELATARIGVVSVEQISARLGESLGFLKTGDRTRAPRHQTLRAALRWSYDLLGEPEQKLFERLSVFAGGCDLEAAEVVGAVNPVDTDQTLDLISALVDKSLVLAEADGETGLRYRMLEPVRQYALERLVQGGDDEDTRRWHATFFMALASEAYPNLRAEPQVKWLERLEKENGNLRSALSWALSAGEVQIAAQLGWALWPFWWIHNYQPEGRRWMEMILAEKEKLPLRLRTRVTIAVTVMAYGQGDGEAVERYAAELMRLSQEAGKNAYAEAIAHGGYGLVATIRGDLETATEHLAEALPLFHEADEDGLAAQTHTWLGTIQLLQGDLEGARLRFEEALTLGRSLGDRMSVHNALFDLAQLALADGDYDTAARRFLNGIAPSQELGDRGNVAHILEGLGVVAGARGDAVMSARLLGASEALISAIGLRGHTYYQFDRTIYDRVNAGVRSTLGAEAYEAALKEGRAMSPERAIEYALGIVEKQPVEVSPVEALPAAASVPATASTGKPAQALGAKAANSGLRIFALGAVRVEKEGEPLASSQDWIQKPKELLYFLLTHPEGRTKEQIGLALWPDASTSQLRSSFHDTVFRLRRALGAKEWISFSKGRYSFGRTLAYSYDVEEFEGMVEEGRKLRLQSPDEAIVYLQTSVDSYRGDFLEDLMSGEWAMERQEELRREYQEALMLLGKMLFAGERYPEAVEVYRKAIAHDEYMEEAHRALMRSQAAMGERGQALRHYEDLVKLLQERLGTSPAPETGELHDRLRAGEEV